jgi:hypothetical protein
MDKGDESSHPEYRCNCFGGRFNSIYALDSLIRELLKGTVQLYDSDALTDIKILNPINIDSKRIYFAGFSLGGGAAWSFMQESRDLLAGVCMFAGWPIGKPYKDYYRESSGDYDVDLHNRLQKQVKRISHIPLFCSTGLSDLQWQAKLGLLQAYQDAGAGLSNFYIVSREGGHSTAVLTQFFESEDTFNYTNHEVQAWGTATGPNYKTGSEWLFSLRKPATPPDPYPEIHPLGYRDYDMNYIYLHDSDEPIMSEMKVASAVTANRTNYILLKGNRYICNKTNGKLTVNDGSYINVNEYQDIEDVRIKNRPGAKVELWRKDLYTTFRS